MDEMLLEDLILNAVSEPSVRGLETLLQNLRCPSVMNNEKVLNQLDLLLDFSIRLANTEQARTNNCI
ncbi:MAG: hypothetical protein RRY34_09455, partial [Victivallaceae bacterium]